MRRWEKSPQKDRSQMRQGLPANPKNPRNRWRSPPAAHRPRTGQSGCDSRLNKSGSNGSSTRGNRCGRDVAGSWPDGCSVGRGVAPAETVSNWSGWSVGTSPPRGRVAAWLIHPRNRSINSRSCGPSGGCLLPPCGFVANVHSGLSSGASAVTKRSVALRFSRVHLAGNRVVKSNCFSCSFAADAPP